MKPQELLEGLSNLAESLPVTAVAFKVPTLPHHYPNELRTEVSAKDIKDLVQWVKDHTHED